MMIVLKWAARISALALLALALPFYFGYENPLPFNHPNNTIWENVALGMMPIVFVGLAIGWKFPRAGGIAILSALGIGFSAGFVTGARMSMNLLIPAIPAALYLIAGFREARKLGRGRS